MQEIAPYQDSDLDQQEIMQQAIIYKKESSRPLSNYHKKMNQAAQEIRKRNPAMLGKRQSLMEAARTKIMQEGFQFVKGKSHSKKEAGSENQSTPKRRKLSLDVREKRLQEVQDIRDLKDRIWFNSLPTNDAYTRHVIMVRERLMMHICVMA